MELTCINPPLRFNSSLLLPPHFDSLMEQILVNFSQEVNFKGVKSMGYHVTKHLDNSSYVWST